MSYIGTIVLGRSPKSYVFRAILIAMLIAVTALSFTLPALAQNKYVIHDGDNVIVYMSSSEDPREVLEEAGLTLGESDTYTTHENEGVSEIRINRVQMVSVYYGDRMFVVGTYGETVGQILKTAQIELTAADRVSCSLDTPTRDGMEVHITHVETKEEEFTQTVPCTERVYEDASLKPGEEKVLAEGKDGVSLIRAKVTYENGREVSRTVLSRRVTQSASDRVVLRGVDRSVKVQENSGYKSYKLSGVYEPDGVSASTLSEDGGIVPGTGYAYSRVLEFSATSYTCEGYTGITATGSVAKRGTVAVDPRVIPLGTRMYIVSSDGKFNYGYCVARDTGGAIKGNIVDLYYDTEAECINFGRRNVKIYILE